MKKLISLVLILIMICPVLAANIEQLGLGLQGINNVETSEQSDRLQAMEAIMESPIDPDIYRLGPGDIISINIIVGDGDLNVTHDLIVAADGKVFFPNIGEIYLSGLNLNQAKEKIRQTVSLTYKEKYQLSLILKQPKKVKIYLTGMIKNPGPLIIYDNSRVSEVVSLAGGNASGGSTRYFYIHRKGETGEVQTLKADIFTAYRNRDISKDIRVQAGDIVEVPDANNEAISKLSSNTEMDKLLFEGKETFVYVYGEVARAGRFEYVPGRRLSDYISFAGGPTQRALLSGVTVTRQVNGRGEQYNVNASDVLYRGDAKKDMEIFGGDVISVPGNFFYFNDFASFVNTILLGLTLYNTVAR